ncbi:MAG: hypothetical protein RL208_278 [Pseudomonadota bacterium]|jgi:hypothetical protein
MRKNNKLIKNILNECYKSEPLTQDKVLDFKSFKEENIKKCMSKLEKKQYTDCQEYLHLQIKHNLCGKNFFNSSSGDLFFYSTSGNGGRRAYNHHCRGLSEYGMNELKKLNNQKLNNIFSFVKIIISFLKTILSFIIKIN